MIEQSFVTILLGIFAMVVGGCGVNRSGEAGLGGISARRESNVSGENAASAQARLATSNAIFALMLGRLPSIAELSELDALPELGASSYRGIQLVADKEEFKIQLAQRFASTFAKTAETSIASLTAFAAAEGAIADIVQAFIKAGIGAVCDSPTPASCIQESLISDTRRVFTAINSSTGTIDEILAVPEFSKFMVQNLVLSLSVPTNHEIRKHLDEMDVLGLSLDNILTKLIDGSKATLASDIATAISASGSSWIQWKKVQAKGSRPDTSRGDEKDGSNDPNGDASFYLDRAHQKDRPQKSIITPNFEVSQIVALSGPANACQPLMACRNCAQVPQLEACLVDAIHLVDKVAQSHIANILALDGIPGNHPADSLTSDSVLANNVAPALGLTEFTFERYAQLSSILKPESSEATAIRVVIQTMLADYRNYSADFNENQAASRLATETEISIPTILDSILLRCDGNGYFGPMGDLELTPLGFACIMTLATQNWLNPVNLIIDAATVSSLIARGITELRSIKNASRDIGDKGLALQEYASSIAPKYLAAQAACTNQLSTTEATLMAKIDSINLTSFYQRIASALGENLEFYMMSPKERLTKILGGLNALGVSYSLPAVNRLAGTQDLVQIGGPYAKQFAAQLGSMDYMEPLAKFRSLLVAFNGSPNAPLSLPICKDFSGHLEESSSAVNLAGVAQVVQDTLNK